jgi:hypothetical protein
MSEDNDPSVSIIELQEEFVQHMERGGRKIMVLALIAVVSGAYFALNYFLQLVVLPYGLGITSQTVDLVDPALVAVGTVSLVISLLWLYAGLRDLMFGRRLGKRIKELRELQAQVSRKYGLGK